MTCDWIPHTPTEGEQSCKGCTWIKTVLTQNDAGKIIVTKCCICRDVLMDDPGDVARCDDWTDEIDEEDDR
ncbi:MAG: hypothetical protein LKJ94_07180 [Candidatus Methanomethylophilus sp.]|jgi:hypothetical protein|nr:hypothetical protein [Methanomethylophilus sp.]MCI2075453.1 hypothetical protein [Methanomethylophilus sp.]MCI2093275.1 hypothetical protein [Methanomethylophilus sp.]